MNKKFLSWVFYDKTQRCKHFFRIMKLTTVCSFALAFSLYAGNSNSQNIKVTVKQNNAELRDVLNTIEKQTDYLFVYDKYVDVNRKVSVNSKKRPLEEVLGELFGETGIKYTVDGAYIVLSSKEKLANVMNPVIQQEKKITGVVKDINGDPVIGANVVDKGNNTNGVITDIDGQFSINVAPGATLMISYIGYVPVEVSIKNKNSVEVTLMENSELLNEVVVVGYGTQKKVNLTAAVATVDTKALENRPSISLNKSLQGVVPGLNITSGNGKLNSNPSMNIRGMGSINSGAEPLILVDGAAIDAADLANMNQQDVESISVLKDASAASIYGARAAFGVVLITTKRGKEGALNINYNNNFEFDMPIRWYDQLNSYDFVNYRNEVSLRNGGNIEYGAEQVERIRQFVNGELPLSPSGHPDTTVPQDLLIKWTNNPSITWQNAYTAAGVGNTNWYREIYKSHSFSQTHNISVSGGSDKFKLYASGAYKKNDGLIAFGEDKMNKYNTSVRMDAQITDWMSFSFGTRWQRQDYDRPTELEINSAGGIFGSMATYEVAPNFPIYDRNGYLIAWPSSPLGLAEGGTTRSVVDNLYQHGEMIITPLKGWRVVGNFTYATDMYNSNEEGKVVYNHDFDGKPWAYTRYRSNSYIQEVNSKTNFMTTNLYTDYENTIQKHHFKILAGVQTENKRLRSYNAYRNGILVDGYRVLDTTTGVGLNGSVIPPSVSGNLNAWSTAGFFGRVNYDFDSRYLFEVSMRYDGSSRFRKGSRWCFSPSFSAGWNVSNEKFWEPLADYVNTFKLRASYGQLGNQNVTDDNGNPIYYPTYVNLPIGINNGMIVNGLRVNTVGMPGLVSSSLTWETVKSVNGAFDFGILDNRLTGSFDYFVRNTEDMRGPAQELPNILGTANPKENNTSLRTKGFELSINWRDRLECGLSYGVGLVLSNSKTKITSYPNLTGSLGTYITGEYVGDLYGYETKGIAQSDQEMQEHLSKVDQSRIGSGWQAGDIMYADLDGDGVITTGKNTLKDHGDLKKIGNDKAKFPFGIRLNADYKGFDLSCFFQGVMHRDFWPADAHTFFGYWWGGGAGWQGCMDYWRPEGSFFGANSDAYLPYPTGDGRNYQKQTRYLQNAAYIRLKNLQVGYTLPVKLTKKIDIQRLRFYLSCENLFTIDGLKTDMFDPETLKTSDYPINKAVSFGLSVTL